MAFTKAHILGMIGEVAVGAYLVNEATRHGLEIYYWRKGNYEVDFVILKGGKIVAIAVKSGKRRMNLSGLELFTKTYKTYRVMTVGTSGVEVGEFLQTPILEWLNR